MIYSRKSHIFPPHRSVAQPGSAPRSGRGGRRFKSSHSDILCKYKQPGLIGSAAFFIGVKLLRLAELCHSELERAMETCPVLVLGLAANEPIGDLPLGTVNAANTAIAEAVATKLNAVSMPSFNYGFAVPFKAFHGACGLHSSTLESALCGIAADASLWGARFFAVVDGSSFSSNMLKAATKRINSLLHGQIKAAGVSWAVDKDVRAIVARLSGIEEPLRMEAAITAIASTILPDLKTDTNILAKNPDKALVKGWIKRGRDPEQFRKSFADCRTGTVPASANMELGLLLRDAIADACIAQLKTSAKKSGIIL